MAQISSRKLTKIKHHLPAGSIRISAIQMNRKVQNIRNSSSPKKDVRNIPSAWHDQYEDNEREIKIEYPILLDVSKMMIEESNKKIHETQIKLGESIKLLE